MNSIEFKNRMFDQFELRINGALVGGVRRVKLDQEVECLPILQLEVAYDSLNCTTDGKRLSDAFNYVENLPVEVFNSLLAKMLESFPNITCGVSCSDCELETCCSELQNIGEDLK